jgi:hypothetical protein
LSKKKSESRYRKIAAECYARVLREAGGRCDKEDVRDAIVQEILAQSIGDDIVDDFVDGLLDAEDAKRTKSSEAGQLDLFSGEDASLDDVLALGGGERVLKRYATRADWYAHLALSARNVARVTEAFVRKQEQIAKLMPFLVDETVTTEAALQNWRSANGENAAA